MSTAPIRLQSVATEGGSSVASAGISITVKNASSISIVVPSYGANVSGINVVLDAVASPDVTSVGFGFVASGCPQMDHVSICMIGSATPTEYGWIAEWNSTQLPNGNSEVFAVATGAVGCGADAFTEVAVTNPTPTIVVPKSDSTVSASQILDCTSPISTNEVYFLLSGGSLSGSEVLGYATSTEYWLAVRMELDRCGRWCLLAHLRRRVPLRWRRG